MVRMVGQQISGRLRVIRSKGAFALRATPRAEDPDSLLDIAWPEADRWARDASRDHRLHGTPLLYWCGNIVLSQAAITPDRLAG